MTARAAPPRPVRPLPESDADRAALALAEVRAGPGPLPGPYVPSSPPPRREPGCDDDDETPAWHPLPGLTAAPAEELEEPRANSPEDLGSTPPAGNPEPQRLPASPAEGAAPTHEPHACKDCPGRIFWAATLDHDGQRVPRFKKRPDGSAVQCGWRSMPVNADPVVPTPADPTGLVVLFHRDGEGIVCRVLRKGERPPPGAPLRTSHFATCPGAQKRRRKT